MTTILNQTAPVVDEIVDLSVPQKFSVEDFVGLDIFASCGRGYARELVHVDRGLRRSRYYDPIYHPEGEPAGNSRKYGDASREV